MSTGRAPNVLTIPAGAPFLATLARGILDGTVVPDFAPRGDPLALAEATIFLPTRRAARALRDAFLAELDGRATLLPRIAPLGDVDDDAGAAEDAAEADGELPPAAAPLERRLALARLVFGFAGALDRSMLRLSDEDGPLIPATAAEAIHLAAELEALIDQIETEEVDVAALGALAPGEHDRYWAITQSFLQVALTAWPEHLEQVGRLDPSRRRRLQLDAAAAQVIAGAGPVIAAGSTGSAPATRRLIAAIAHAPRGAVVLPGFDRDGLDDAAWTALRDGDAPGLYGHPQRGLSRLAQALGVSRAEVRELAPASPALAARARLAGDALRPAETTDAWGASSGDLFEVVGSLDGVALVDAPHPRGEAAAIAVALRETLATPGKTAALVTPDRGLAARVATELARWGVAIDDSAGAALKATPAGGLLRLVAEAAFDSRPAPLLALLRHPRCRLADAPGLGPRATDALDILAFREALPGRGFEALRRALREPEEGERRHGPAKRFGGPDRAAARALVDSLEAALSPLASALDAPTAPLERLAAALTGAYTEIAGEAEGDDAEAVVQFLEELREAALEAEPIAPRAFPGVLVALMAGRVVRPPRDRHPRLRILGPLEARLLHVDHMVLGGLNEGVWPPTPQSDAWINRPLRAQLGLAPPERRIGLSAHDFVQGLGAREVTLTRAAKAGGAPTIPSRWLQRLAAVADPIAHAAAKARGARLARLAEKLDEAPREPAPRPPEPRPPLALRPLQISVTGVETWLRDPYSLYARAVLRLDELGPVGPEPGARELGDVIHAALEAFARSGLTAADPDARPALLRFGEAAFGPLLERDDARLLWWPRYARIVDWFLGFERSRAPFVARTLVEQTAAHRFTTRMGREFALTARADRIDALNDGDFAILDYKTGRTASVKQVLAGFAPQLPLEAALLAVGGFADAAPDGGTPSGLALIRLTGRDPAGEVVDVRAKDEPIADVAAKALTRFRQVVDRFEDEAEPYRSLSHPTFLSRPEGPYAHLARVKEWSATGGASDGEGDGE
ncbi:ATP-dependent helicase/nuclease subunit B [Methylopila capsulata]|uniref:ATP-dependent helicase/nuclease subunit B n=1 Tax=Methylopila capsulata TaxID=61654 RepID=A0A9W6IS05_9HYPH|nr:double-strand break repair protein AddB [Methylopila capsulata]MBM7851202.1 ATP-dependent helicase/nuclease subunit B [Methylopila capsulata]GLK54260.1 double-strand break repair protein AddB [Methylopila capsulata]